MTRYTPNSTGTYLIAFPAIFFIAAMLLVLVLLFILIIMPVVSRQKRRASKCPSCGTRLRVKDHFCSHCGYQLHKEVHRVSSPLDQLYAPAVLAVPTISPTACPSCRAAIQPEDIFCGSCGNRIISSTTQTQRHI